MVSIASDEATPQIPPIATPYSTRSSRNIVNEGAAADSSSNTEKNTIFSIKTGLRPYFSAARPKISAPIGRTASVSRIASVTSSMPTWKDCAISLSRKTSTKKSKASSVQLEKLAIAALRCSGVQPNIMLSLP
ncbi:hypothetical protein D3C78_1416800 [compost metagenome]